MSWTEISDRFNRFVSEVFIRLRYLDGQQWFFLALGLGALIYLLSGMGKIEED